MAALDSLREYLGYEPPANAERALEWAEELIKTDPCVLPFEDDNADHQAALERAKNAQVEFWIEIAGGNEDGDAEIDQSLDILQPGGKLTVGTADFPEPLSVIAPRVDVILRGAGLWSASLKVYPERRRFVYYT